MGTFEEANQVVHTVESEWHYPIMTKYGFVPLDKTGIGFVRQYRYQHPLNNCMVCVHTGVNADYWTNETQGGFGYYGTLENHVQKIVDGRLV